MLTTALIRDVIRLGRGLHGLRTSDGYEGQGTRLESTISSNVKGHLKEAPDLRSPHLPAPLIASAHSVLMIATICTLAAGIGRQY